MSAHTVVIYHKSDFDGIFCREIALKFLGDDGVDYLGWEYGEPVPPILPDQQLYILDLSVDALMTHPKLIWIDHHKTAIEKYQFPIRGLRIDGVAACRLAWQWFVRGLDDDSKATLATDWPTKQDFVYRKVTEPLAVRLAGEYDIWDKRDPDADLFQHGLRSCELTEGIWEDLLGHDLTEQKRTVETLLISGDAVAYAETQKNERIIGNNGFTVQWEGLTFLCCNAGSYNSHLFTAGIKPEHEGLLGFCLRANGRWTVSLYGVPHRPDVDLSGIAAKYGGGGHRQACGFTVDRLPFLPRANEVLPADEQIANIMGNFDFETVHQTMMATQWRWLLDTESPSQDRLRETARELLMEVQAGVNAGEWGSCETGGFRASKDLNGVLELSFEVKRVLGVLPD